MPSQACLLPSCCLHTLLHTRQMDLMTTLMCPECAFFPSASFTGLPCDCNTALSVYDAAIPSQHPCLRRFDLSYQTEGQKYEQPVMIHRAILGSVERMFAILTEHFAAKWPFWLNPRQVCRT